VTEPVLRPIRKLLPPWKMGGLDLSPLIVVLVIYFLRSPSWTRWSVSDIPCAEERKSLP